MKQHIELIKVAKAITRQRVHVLKKTKAQITKETRVSSTSVRNAERGNMSKMSVVTLDRIARGLGWTLIELLQAANREQISGSNNDP